MKLNFEEKIKYFSMVGALLGLYAVILNLAVAIPNGGISYFWMRISLLSMILVWVVHIYTNWNDISFKNVHCK